MLPDGTRKGAAGARGFAGLQDLAAQVPSDGPPASPKAADLGADPSEGPRTAAPQLSSPTQNQGSYQGPPARKSILTSRGKLIVGGLVVVAVIWAIADQGSNSSNTPATPAATYTHAPLKPLTEARPPVGTDIVLSSAQIRYCLSEKIRLEGAQSVLDTYSQTDVDRFNGMVNDYNSRCGSFRYQAGTLDAVRAQVDANQLELQSEGRARFQR
jgi:hypothetical protein